MGTWQGKWGHDAFLAAQKSIMSPFSAHFSEKFGDGL